MTTARALGSWFPILWLCLALVLTACDGGESEAAPEEATARPEEAQSSSRAGSGPEADPRSQRGAFEVEISGDLEGSFSGGDASAVRGLRGEGYELRIEMRESGPERPSERAGLTFQTYVGEAGYGEEEGTYPVQSLRAGTDGTFATLHFPPARELNPRWSLLQADSGELVIEEATEERVRGRFSIVSEAMEVGGQAVKPAFEAQGSFEAQRVDAP